MFGYVTVVGQILLLKIIDVYCYIEQFYIRGKKNSNPRRFISREVQCQQGTIFASKCEDMSQLSIPP